MKVSQLTLIGFLSSAFILACLLTPTSYFAMEGVTFVTTELRETSSRTQFVQTKMGLGDKESLERLPQELGEWRAGPDLDWDNVSAALNPDFLLARGYNRPGVYRPVTLVIETSKNVSSFHPAPTCFTFQGFEIKLSGFDVLIPSLGSEWAREQWLAQIEAGTLANDGIYGKYLLAEKTMKGGWKESTLAVYFYIKSEAFGGTDNIAWVRATMPVADAENITAELALAQDLLGEVLPEMFTLLPPPGTVLDSVAGPENLPVAAAVLAAAAAPAVGAAAVELRRAGGTKAPATPTAKPPAPPPKGSLRPPPLPPERPAQVVPRGPPARLVPAKSKK